MALFDLTETACPSLLEYKGFPKLDTITLIRHKTSPAKAVHDYFQQNVIPSIEEISKFQRSHFTNITTDTLRNIRGSLGVRGAQFGNHCPNALMYLTTKNQVTDGGIQRRKRSASDLGVV
jgi:hypothetical protein